MIDAHYLALSSRTQRVNQTAFSLPELQNCLYLVVDVLVELLFCPLRLPLQPRFVVRDNVRTIQVVSGYSINFDRLLGLTQSSTMAARKELGRPRFVPLARCSRMSSGPLP